MNRKQIGTFLLFLLIATCAYCAVNTVSLPYIAQEKFDGRKLTLNNVLEENDYFTRYYITYMSGNLKISGIMNIPKGKGPFPVIITAHGFIDPKFYTNGRGLKREQYYLAREGYAVLHPDYRNHADSDKDPDNSLRLNLGYTEDVINAVYAIKNSNISSLDKNNIGLLGHSLGGGVALNMMVTKPGLIQAYVLFAPVSADYRKNFERWISHRNPKLAEKVPQKYGNPQVRDKIIELYGSPLKNPKFWDNMSAKTFIKNITEPIMLHHGTIDQDVPIEWSEELVTLLKYDNKHIEYFKYKGEKHEFINAWPLVMKRSTTFFDEYLK